MIVFPDPWEALCISRLLPDRSVIAYEAEGVRGEFEQLGVSFTLAQVRGDLLTVTLLTEFAPVPEPSANPIIAFKPSARLEKTGHRFALAAAALAGSIENKLMLAALASEAGVAIASQDGIRVGEPSFDQLAARFGLPFVAQSPRGFAGRRTFAVASSEDWTAVEALLKGRPAKIASWASGRPGTSNAVVDCSGRVQVSAPIFQLTGEPDLTPHRLGSCGNDFTWRPDPQPGDAPARIAEALGPVLAARGYRGHFGIDWVWDGTTCTLIEVNARLTASFGLYVSHRPELLHAHLTAIGGGAIEAKHLPCCEGGQLVVYNTGKTSLPPLIGPNCWPAPGPAIEPGAKRGRLIVPGSVVNEQGERLIHLG
jgi:hypothetical protein